jgi:hypothetical protein
MWKVASNNPHFDSNWFDPIVIKFAQLVAEHEREECAKICDDWANGWCSEPEMAEMAAEIRARGQE